MQDAEEKRQGTQLSLLGPHYIEVLRAETMSRGQTAPGGIESKRKQRAEAGALVGKGENQAKWYVLQSVCTRRHLNSGVCGQDGVFKARTGVVCTPSGSVLFPQPLARYRGDRCLGVSKLAHVRSASHGIPESDSSQSIRTKSGGGCGVSWAVEQRPASTKPGAFRGE
ncbi:hypothetical protein VUR80DRAFT_9348 [Thermomyces stellatus]